MSIKDFQETYQLSDGTLESKIKAVAFITGMTIEEVENLPIEQFKKLGKGLEFPELKDDGYKPVLRLKGLKLISASTIKELTAGEFVDLTHYTKDQESIIENLHKILAIFYKPKYGWFNKKKYTRAEVSDKILNEVDIKDAYGYSVFFLKSWNRFIKIIKPFLIAKLKIAEKDLAQRTKTKARI